MKPEIQLVHDNHLMITGYFTGYLRVICWENPGYEHHWHSSEQPL